MIGVVVALVAIGAYAVLGNSVASSRIATADGALATTRSHRADFEQSMSDIGHSFDAMSGSSFNPTQYKATVDQFVAKSQQELAAVAGDQAKLDGASSRLHDSAWLTLLDKGRLDHESSRIEHAKKALAAAKTISTDFVQDGAFFEAFADSLVDLDTLVTQSQANNAVGATAAIAKLKTDTDKALSLVTAPGLPEEVHQFMTLFQQLATDLQNEYNASASGDSSAAAAAKSKGDSDLAALQKVDTSAIGAKINSFYQPLESTYKQEMQLASS